MDDLQASAKKLKDKCAGALKYLVYSSKHHQAYSSGCREADLGLLDSIAMRQLGRQLALRMHADALLALTYIPTSDHTRRAAEWS